MWAEQALSLALGYSEFVSQRGGVHCNLLVLDEVLQVCSSSPSNLKNSRRHRSKRVIFGNIRIVV